LTFKNALISVSDRKGLTSFLEKIEAKKSHIVSTGGTAKNLVQSGFKVTPVESWTGYPEVMGGRVKTLHPKVYMSLLYRAEDQNLLKEYNILEFDLI